jgi:hypothetical protein
MKCKTSRRYDSRLSTLFLCTNIFVKVLESEKTEKEKDLAEAAKTQRNLGAPDSVRCARLDSGQQAALRNSSAAYG